jgi:hypothetical protein
MDPILYSTEWGALYLALLVISMLPAMLLLPASRWLAMAMILLFICDRIAVNMLPETLALFFLAFAYFLVAIAIVITHQGRSAVIVGLCLTVSVIAFIGGGFGIVSWDATGTVQEITGLIAMVSIIVRRQGGGHKHASVDHGRPAGSGPRAAGMAPAHRHHRR